MARSLTPLNSFSKIRTALLETKEAIKVERLRGGFPIVKLADVTPHIKRFSIGASLNGVELVEISRILRMAGEISEFISNLKNDEFAFERLYYWQEKLIILPDVVKKMRLSLSDDGSVLDDASDELKGIRYNIKRSEDGVRGELEKIVRGSQAKFLSDALITIRNERYVVPVKHEYRNHFGGVVHDESATGQTLYIEPRQVVELNNKLRQFQIKEKQEIERILFELSAMLAPFAEEIAQNAYVLGHLDFMQAKAQLARQQKAVIPNISKDNQVNIRQARHPLIAEEKIVPNDLVIGEDYRLLVVTGPNTGGKTITLKTLGLLQVMSQSGLAIPAARESTVGIFAEIFADIGDEQSIEQNLSTFSSHMTNIVKILKATDNHSLILLDELGAGTDPQEGAALAIAILDALRNADAYVMATTHYPELKAYAYNRPQTLNASMEFDLKTLSPTYHLLIGMPGRSNAFEISESLGLPDEILREARGLIDEDSQDLNNMIADLEEKRRIARDEYFQVQKDVQEAKNLLKDLENGYQTFLDKRESELAKAQQKAHEIVEKAEVQVDKLLREIREIKAHAADSVVKEHELIDMKSKFSSLKQEKEALSQNKVLQKAKKAKEFKVGDEVVVTTFGQRGILLEQISKKEWIVQVGIIKMTVKLVDLAPVKHEKKKGADKIARLRMPVSKNSRSSSLNTNVNSKLDLRGEYYENALVRLDRFLDQSTLVGLSQVSIVHGKGTGVLREAVSRFLRSDHRVENFSLAPANEGGSGVTLVDLA